ncbi:MAG: hypothetical protein ACREDZ_05645 [Kiloniellales bacterium]
MTGIATGGYSGAGRLPGHLATAALASGDGPLIDLKPLQRSEALRWPRPEARLRERPPFPGESDPRRTPAAEARAAQPATRQPELSPHAATRFVVQLLGQADSEAQPPLAQHRDGARLTCDAYRRAGGEPPADCESAQVFRIAV